MPDRRIHRADLFALVVLALLITVTAWGHFGLQNRLYDIDTLTFYIPWYTHLGERLSSGDVPGWFDMQFSGAPFAADPQSGWMYLPAMLVFIFTGGASGYAIFLILHWLLASGFMYALARVLGLSAPVALFTAVSFTFGPFITHTHHLLLRSHLAIWLPLTMLGIELAARAKGKRQQALGWMLAGIALSQVLAAWIGQGIYLAGLFAAFHAFWRLIVQPPEHVRTWRNRVLRLTLGGITMAGTMAATGAAGLLPRLEWNPRTNIVGGDYSGQHTGTSRAFSFPQILGSLIGYEGSRLYWYAGAATLLLAVLAVVIAWRRQPVGFLAIASVISVVLALPDNVVHYLFYLLPEFETLHWHQPNRAMVILVCTLPLLAGFALDSLPAWAGSRLSLALPIAAASLFVLARVTLPDEWQRIGAETWIALAITTVLLTTLILLVASGRGSSAWIVPALLALLAWWDPTGNAITSAWRGPVPQPEAEAIVRRLAETTPYTGAEAFLVNLKAEGEVFRYFGLDELHWVEERSLRENSYTSRFDTVDVAKIVPPPRAMLLELDGIQGYDPVHILRYEEFFIGVNGKGQNYHFIEVLHDGVDSQLLDLLNLRYIVVPSGVDGGWDGAELIDLGYFDSEVYADEHVRILVNESALPRAWVVHEVVTVDEGSAMETLTSPGFDPTTTAVIETSPPSLAAATGQEEVTWVPTETSDVVAADVTLSADGLVVFSEIWDPNWVAYVDGSKTDLLVANHILRAVAVPAGSHRVEIRYESETLRVGVWISIAAWLAIVTLACTTLVDRRR